MDILVFGQESWSGHLHHKAATCNSGDLTAPRAKEQQETAHTTALQRHHKNDCFSKMFGWQRKTCKPRWGFEFGATCTVGVSRALQSAAPEPQTPSQQMGSIALIIHARHLHMGESFSVREPQQK